jgi:D-aspartate ligase
MIPGGGETQFSYAALWCRGRPVASMVTRRTRQYAVVFGTGTFVETIDKPEIEANAVRILESLDYHGLVEIEFKLDTRDGQYKILDANTRTWAWIGLGEPAGVDFPWLAWRMEMGDAPELKRGRAGASWRHLPRDILASLHEVKAGRMTAASLVKSLFSGSTGAVLAFDDLLPGIVDVPLVTPRLLRRLIGRRRA